MTTVRHTDDRGLIPAIYGEFMEHFSKVKPETLPPHRSTDHAIDLEPAHNLLYGGIYNLSEFESSTLKAYIEANLANGCIHQSSSPAPAPSLITKKKDGGLTLRVDYWALNLVTVKNPYPLPLFSDMLDCVREARIFTKLDIRGRYNVIQIMEGREWNTVFRTSYGHIEY